MGFSQVLASMLEMVSGLLWFLVHCHHQSLDIEEGSNVGRRGVYIYQVDQCSIIGPDDG